MQPQLVTSSNTTNKKTLLKASAMIGGDLSSHSTDSFRGFYTSDQPLSQSLLVSPVQPRDRQLRSQLNPLDDDPENKTEYNTIIMLIHSTVHKQTRGGRP